MDGDGATWNAIVPIAVTIEFDRFFSKNYLERVVSKRVRNMSFGIVPCAERHFVNLPRMPIPFLTRKLTSSAIMESSAFPAATSRS